MSISSGEYDVGTLDQLVGLSDDLNKLDSTAEGVTRKLVQYFGEVLEDDKSKLAENLHVGNTILSNIYSYYYYDYDYYYYY
uniref:V-type proton ATPase subunit C n=1 Tax=Heterorhabditis bacteriophora TaxID=37862 RepID=A0A1I7WS33_HETBA